jgi:brefeldin A-inhibited guanine nucleotide-exchange protein
LSPGSDPLLSGSPSNGSNSTLDRRRVFKQIIVKCVLQLLLIETTHELLQNQEVYSTIPPEQLLRLMAELDHSYQFARSFNGDRELRTGLWKVGMSIRIKFKGVTPFINDALVGFMKHLPNLLKQESSSAATLVNILLRMYLDQRPEHQAVREKVVTRLVPSVHVSHFIRVGSD